jgi:hypothetical protein
MEWINDDNDNDNDDDHDDGGGGGGARMSRLYCTTVCPTSLFYPN